MVIKGLNHVGLVVSDLDRAISFYQNALGLRLVQRQVRNKGPIEKVVGYSDAHLEFALMEFQSGGTLELIYYFSPGSIDRPTLHRSVIGGSHIGFNVENIDEVFESIKKHGGTELNPPVEVIPGKKVCYLQDIDENWIELIEIKESSN